MRALVFLAFCCAAQWVHSAEVQDLRAWHSEGQTRLVFDLSGTVSYEVISMSNPNRVVIDLANVRARTPLQLPAAAAAHVKQLRYAQRGEQELRVVLDLTRPVRIRDAQLAPQEQASGSRVVIDLLDDAAATTRAEPVAVAAPPVPKPTAPPFTQPIATPTPGAAAAAKLSPKPVGRKARDIVIAIDAGHGGADVGAIGTSGTYEKDITLAVARELAALINRTSGMRAVLTRSRDEYLALRERTERARAHKADLFVSIHADAVRNKRVQGSSVFVLSQRGASSEAARWLAEQENAVDLVGGVSLDDKDHVLKSVLLDLSQTASLEASLDVASQVLSALKTVGKTHSGQVQSAGFMVLKSPDIPSLLVETAFISNPDEERRLRNPKFRRQLAVAIQTGIISYFNQNAPMGTQFAEK